MAPDAPLAFYSYSREDSAFVLRLAEDLKAAGASGTVGPNLDQLKPKEAIVVHQVTNGGAIMPAFKGKLSPAQIQAVAKFVSSSAGK